MEHPLISALLITLNEEERLERALSSLLGFSEIVVVDGGSTDQTVSIAKRFTSRVYVHPFDTFPLQRNRAMEYARYDWVFFLDADEEVSPFLKEEIFRLSLDGTPYRGFRIPRKSFYLGKWIRYGGWYPDYQIRLFHKKWGRFVGKKVHEKAEIQGKVGTLKGEILHYPYKDLHHHLKKTIYYARLRSEENDLPPSPFSLFLKPMFRFLRSYLYKQGFRMGIRGFILAGMGAFSLFLSEAFRWEKFFRKKGDL
jgi:glycosyltransferase involved in cell wall biosynthesis